MSLTARSPTGRKRKSWLNRTLVVWREAVGIDDCCAVLAFANIAAVAERLAECEPALTGEAVLDDGGPKDQPDELFWEVLQPRAPFQPR
jgi:hypothetical protein